MINLIRKSNICANRSVVLRKSRSLVSTSTCKIRVSDSVWRRRLPIPTVGGKLLKDSDFIDTEVDSKELDTDAGHLERSYDEYVGELKEQKKKLRHILTKKTMNKHPKQPNMLTFNEREHIKFLHESDPVEWSVERLSESFPALPHVIRKIIKNKWKPDSLERIKEFDNQVLENWNKLSRNELEASPSTLNHLKKFINKRDNLKVQLNNPQFFPEPEVPKKITWGDGPLSKLLTKYEKEIERLKSRHLEKIALNEGGNMGNVIAISEKPVSTIEEDIKFEIETRDKTDDSFMIGNPQSRGTDVTLTELKQVILEKTEKRSKPLSKFEEALLDKTLQGDRRPKQHIKVKEETDHSHKNETQESYGKKSTEKERKVGSYNVIRDIVKDKVSKNNTREIPQFEDRPEVDEDLRIDDQTKSLKEEDLGQFFQRLRDEVAVETKVERKETGEKTPVQFYGTEKDKEMVERDFEILCDSSFWSGDKTRKKSKDALTLETFTVNTKASPHLSPTLKTYFAYNYPDKVDIPKDKWVKGMTYRVKDCYYDDDGEFLYRVPGVTQD